MNINSKLNNELVHEFPIETGVDYDGGKAWPRFHPHEGVAKLKHWKEVAKIAGWSENQIPELIGIEHWEEGDKYFPCDQRELFILKGRLIMN